MFTVVPCQADECDTTRPLTNRRGAAIMQVNQIAANNCACLNNLYMTLPITYLRTAYGRFRACKHLELSGGNQSVQERPHRQAHPLHHCNPSTWLLHCSAACVVSTSQIGWPNSAGQGSKLATLQRDDAGGWFAGGLPLQAKSSGPRSRLRRQPVQTPAAKNPQREQERRGTGGVPAMGTWTNTLHDSQP